MWTSACSAGGISPGTRFLLQCQTRGATIPWRELLCSTRVTFRKPRRTSWATDSTSPTPSVSSQKVTGLSVAVTAHLCIRAGEHNSPASCMAHGVSWCHAWTASSLSKVWIFFDRYRYGMTSSTEESFYFCFITVIKLALAAALYKLWQGKTLKLYNEFLMVKYFLYQELEHSLVWKHAADYSLIM